MNPRAGPRASAKLVLQNLRLHCLHVTLTPHGGELRYDPPLRRCTCITLAPTQGMGAGPVATCYRDATEEVDGTSVRHRHLGGPGHAAIAMRRPNAASTAASLLNLFYEPARS
jgi:hypothetical protein